MELNTACTALGALAQESRLEAFRLLVRAGDDGMPAGEIADALEVPSNTLSTHLGILVRAGLLSSERRGRHIIYRVDFAGARTLLGFLLEDCCQGSRAVCGPAIESVRPGCCDPI